MDLNCISCTGVQTAQQLFSVKHNFLILIVSKKSAIYGVCT